MVVSIPMLRVVIAVLTLSFTATSLEAQAGATPEAIGELSGEDLQQGARLFTGMCARCHGVGGTGGEGPSLARPRLPRAPDDATLMRVIQVGIPGTEMPRSRLMTKLELRQLAGYVRGIARVSPRTLPGNAKNGQRLYQRSGCHICHMTGGEGGSFGPDLSDVGTRRSPEHLKETLVAPAATVSEDYLVVRIKTVGGGEIRGIRANEDAFTIQLRDESNRFHSFEKRELVELTKEFDQSLMPSYRADFSPSEIDDLVAYLASLRSEP